MAKSVVILSIWLLCSTSNGWCQGNPPKHQLGSRENPYYTALEDKITLQQHLESRIGDLESKINQKFESLKEAVDVAKKSTDAHLAVMNEFRGALKDQTATFVTRTELLAAMGFLVAVIFGLLQYQKSRKKE